MDLVLLAPDAVAIAVCAIAVATDVRHMRIPNRFTVPAILCGIALNVALGWMIGGAAGALWWLLAAVAGATVGLVVFGIPAAFGFVGMGDVKLAIAAGALVRWPLALPLVLYAALAGGVLAIGYAVAGGRLGAVGRNLMSLTATPDSRLHRMPYALAIGIGCVVAVASRHVQALRIVWL